MKYNLALLHLESTSRADVHAEGETSMYCRYQINKIINEERPRMLWSQIFNYRVLCFLFVIGLSGCASTEEKASDLSLNYGSVTTPISQGSKTGAPDKKVSEITRKGLSIASSPIFWKGYKDYKELGAINLFIRRIERGETLGDAARRAYGKSKFGGGVAFYGKGVDITLLNHSKGACYFVADLKGKPAKIRDAEGLDAYLFSHSIREKEYVWNNSKAILKGIQDKQISVENERAYLNKQISLGNSGIQTSENKLNKNQSFQNNQCALLKHRPIRKAPKLPDQERVTQQAHGSCFAKMGSDNAALLAATGAVMRFNKVSWLNDFATYTSGKKDQCVEVEVSLWNDFSCKLQGAFSDELRKSCINDVLESCATKAINNCNRDYLRWEREKESIKAEPYILQKACNSEIQNIQKQRQVIALNKQKLPGNAQQIELRQAEVASFSQKVDADEAAISAAIPLDQAICEL